MAEVAPGAPSARVLVVDDEEDILTTTSAALRRRLDNVEVLTASSGGEALGILQEQDVDLVVTDFRMPHMNGLELLERAAGVAPHTKRILMTAYPDLYLAVEALNEQRISYFLVKPLDPHAFPRQVADCLLGRHLEKARDQMADSAADLARRWASQGA